jgi:hypothetical protein
VRQDVQKGQPALFLCVVDRWCLHSTRWCASAAGLGVLAGLSDDVLLGLLELLPAADLARLGLVSQALYCFAHTNDLWKALVLQVGAGQGVGLCEWSGLSMLSGFSGLSGVWECSRVWSLHAPPAQQGFDRAWLGAGWRLYTEAAHRVHSRLSCCLL